ncbi:lysophospholipase catalytic domain-containing protein [Dendryphion nanum]|uniref:Lysophospholipase n=1 Tax=Dendryphion nanum TaxID=256645 RepID=A0A9P9EBV8_9PLEO|nr:lysophospholipase catalytic domain-containing protein [Dendryphion nanum]
MKVSSILAASTLTCLDTASALTPRQPEVEALDSWKRATNQAPNGYTPSRVDCPSTRPSIRVANGLSPQETEWLKKRRANTVQPLGDLLGRLNIRDFDGVGYINKYSRNTTALPNVAIAFSGGGYRAMLNGAGYLAAFDGRTAGSKNAGHIGGLLQASTYIAGLSGGGWLVGSIYANNFSSVQSIVDKGNIWQLGRDIEPGPEESKLKIFQVVDTGAYIKELVDSVDAKLKAGFDTSITDYWGRALSFQLVDAPKGGPGFTYSSIQDDDDFKNANAPLPFLLADERAPGEIAISLNTTNIEFNPWEMGSYDPTLYGFAPLKYVGSNFSAGQLSEGKECIAGFDNLGFVMGTSSSLFNQIVFALEGMPALLKTALTGVLNALGRSEDDIADWAPNPFFGFNPRTNPSARDPQLTLVDGGEDLQNIPFNPLIQPQRAVDVIFAVDSSADTVAPSAPNWSNGTALVATYYRTTNATMQNGTAFPAIPDTNTFVNLGLNNGPTFFGCNAANATTASGTAPLIVYLPNAPYVFQSNTSTTKMSYSNEERNAMILNAYNGATQGNATLDANWPTCVGCAILSRSFVRNNEKVPAACESCFTRYCWNGTLAPNTPPTPYSPKTKLTPITLKKSGAERFIPNIFGFALAAAVSGYLVL